MNSLGTLVRVKIKARTKVIGATEGFLRLNRNILLFGHKFLLIKTFICPNIGFMEYTHIFMSL